MDKLIVQLSKVGDVLNVLGIARLATKFGKRVGIMTCAEYAPLLDGCSYVDKVIFDGKPWEIEKAVEQAKKLCPAVHVTQVNGPREVVNKFAYQPAGQTQCVTDSFDRESWKLLGLLDEWGKEPLVFDQRDEDREELLFEHAKQQINKKKKIILIAPDSVSSPFSYRELLMTLVQLKYRDCRVVNLCDIKADRFYDLLGLYEIAHCLITVDTAHLHLARAVPSLPVMALVQDSPTYWHGTAWRPQHHFHCRYGDFPKRALEMFTAIENLAYETSKTGFVHLYPGEVRHDCSRIDLAIQPGSIGRDSSLVLNDKEHFPMLRDALLSSLNHVASDAIVYFSRRETKFNLHFDSEHKHPEYPFYAYRLHQGQFVPAADLFCAPAEFWRKILPEIPDLVLAPDAYWSRCLVEIFKAHGAREIEPVIYE